MRRALILMGCLALLMTACGDDDAAPTTAAPPVSSTTVAPATTQATTTTTVPATTTTAAATHPGSPFVSTVESGYVFGTENGLATDDDLPFELGSITVHWYRTMAFVVAVYDGLDPASSEYLCPGNSIRTDAGFEYVSNAPVPGADCSNSPGTLIESVPGLSGAQECNGLVSYITTIPSGLDGELYGTVEVYPPSGRFVGATGTVVVTGSDLPQIDPTTLSC